MGKLDELKEQLETKKTEIRSYIDAKEADKAESAMQEKRNLETLIKAQEELEAEEKRELENQKNNKKEEGIEMGKVNEMRSIVKVLMGQQLSEEERAVITSIDNSALIPKEFIAEVQKVMNGYGALKGYCHVIPVTKNEGTMPVVNMEQSSLSDIAENGDNIVDGTFASTEITYKCNKVGTLDTLTSESIDDAEVEIETLIRENFANIAVIKENAKILKVLKDNATSVEGTTYEDLEKAMDSMPPAVKFGLATFVNTSSYSYLKNLKDKNGRPLNLVTTGVDGKEYFNGKELITVDATLLPNAETKTFTAVVANPKEAVKFFERKGITVAKSTEAGFSNDTVKLRILERNDARLGNARSIKKIEF